MSVDATAELSPTDQRALLAAASHAISNKLFGRPPDERITETSPALVEPRASFVTLHHGDRLLGCIGTLEPIRPLYLDVRHNAVAAAFDDPRLPAITPAEFETMSIKVSVLSPLEPFEAASYDALLTTMAARPDGLLVAAGRRRATFLPSVWEQVSTASAFLEALWHKAGLRPREWPDDLELWRYHTEELADDGPRARP